MLSFFSDMFHALKKAYRKRNEPGFEEIFEKKRKGSIYDISGQNSWTTWLSAIKQYLRNIYRINCIDHVIVITLEVEHETLSFFLFSMGFGNRHGHFHLSDLPLFIEDHLRSEARRAPIEREFTFSSNPHTLSYISLCRVLYQVNRITLYGGTGALALFSLSGFICSLWGIFL